MLAELVRIVAVYAARPTAPLFAVGAVPVPSIAANLPPSFVQLVSRLCVLQCPHVAPLAPAVALAFLAPTLRRIALLVRAMTATDDDFDACGVVTLRNDIEALLATIGAPPLAQVHRCKKDFFFCNGREKKIILTHTY